jgi:MFS family permease
MEPNKSGAVAAGSSSAQRIGLFCVCLAGFAFSANYTNHSPLIPALSEAFHFSLALAGFLTTGIFLTHAATQIPGGHLADRFGSKHVLTAALALVCVGNFAIASSNSYTQLLFWKIFVGLGTGTCFVAGARYISAAFAGRQSQMAQGLYGGSVLVGSGFVIFAVPRISGAYGWRGAFTATAAVAALAWVVWAIAAPIPARSGTTPASGFSGMLADGQLWLLGIIQMASFGLVMVVSAWITTFLRKGMFLSAVSSGQLGSLALLLGIIIRPLGGAVLHRIGTRPMLFCSLLLNAAGCFMLARAGQSIPLAASAIVILGIGCGLPYAALFTRAAGLYPGRAGAAMGLVNMLGIVMILAAPPVIGYLVDWTGTFQSSFFALGAFSLLACGGALGIKAS